MLTRADLKVLDLLFPGDTLSASQDCVAWKTAPADSRARLKELRVIHIRGRTNQAPIELLNLDALMTARAALALPEPTPPTPKVVHEPCTCEGGVVYSTALYEVSVRETGEERFRTVTQQRQCPKCEGLGYRKVLGSAPLDLSGVRTGRTSSTVSPGLSLPTSLVELHGVRSGRTSLPTPNLAHVDVKVIKMDGIKKAPSPEDTTAHEVTLAHLLPSDLLERVSEQADTSVHTTLKRLKKLLKGTKRVGHKHGGNRSWWKGLRLAGWFGKFGGTELTAVPNNYLEWLLKYSPRWKRRDTNLEVLVSLELVRRRAMTIDDWGIKYADWLE
jgi:hypothetical protein